MSGMSIICQAILSTLYHCGIKINCRRVGLSFFPSFFQWYYSQRHQSSVVGDFWWGGWRWWLFDYFFLIKFFFALIMKNLYLYKIQLICHRLFF